MLTTTNTMYNTTDNRYEGKDPALKAAMALADHLRAKYTMQRDDDMQGEVWDRIIANEQAWLDQITVHTNYEGAPAVGFETDTEWAFGLSLNVLEDLGHPGFYYEPYFSFLVNIYPI